MASKVAVVGEGKNTRETIASRLMDEYNNASEEMKPSTNEDGMLINENGRQFDSFSIPDEPDSYGKSMETDTLKGEEPKELPEFSEKDFEETQKMLNASSKLRHLRRDAEDVKKQKHGITRASFKDLKTIGVGDAAKFQSPDDVIQYHLDKWETAEELESYLKGSVKDPKVKERINNFFENPVTHEVLELSNNTEVKNETQELEFKRGLILYFKQNDEYLKKIDEEVNRFNKEMDELTSEISTALNPLRDDVYSYSKVLTDMAVIKDGDDEETIKKKTIEAKRAKAIRSAFTLENMIELIESKPSIIYNSLRDFKNEQRLKDIGEHYAKKLKRCDISHDLFGFLSDDPKQSIEYTFLPLGDYPEGLEGFTVFFIIRSLSMSLPDKMDETFHSAVYIVLSQLLENKLNDEAKETLRNSMIKFLNKFRKE